MTTMRLPSCCAFSAISAASDDAERLTASATSTFTPARRTTVDTTAP